MRSVRAIGAPERTKRPLQPPLVSPHPRPRHWLRASPLLVGLLAIVGSERRVDTQAPAPSMLHPRLAVRTVVSGLTEPTTMAFIGRNDILVLEKSTGRVRRVVHGKPTLAGGYLFRFKLKDDRKSFALVDPRLADRVADNLAKFEVTESESLLVGMNFGVGTDVETGPDGNLYVVSLSNGAIYEIFRRR